MNWTNQKINKLKGLWEQGIIATEIAKIFGTSKNSIIGKANRLNCTPRKQGGTRRKRSQNIFKELPKITPIIELENPTLLMSLSKLILCIAYRVHNVRTFTIPSILYGFDTVNRYLTTSYPQDNSY